MKVRYAPRAIDDLASIADYLSHRNPQAARDIEARIHATIRVLREFSASGRKVAHNADIRVMPVSRYPYSIFYQVESGHIVVLHIRHAARRPIVKT